MTNVTEIVRGLDLATWSSWMLAGLTTLVLLIGLAYVLRGLARSLRGKDWVGALGIISMGIALALNAEGMYHLITTKVDNIPTLLVWAVFFVFESFQVRAMILAEQAYKEHQHPGKFAWLVWGIGLVSGMVVSLAAKDAAEVAFRIALPVMVAAMWHVCLVAQGVKARTSRWAFGYRVEAWLVTLGVRMPSTDSEVKVDYDKARRERQIKKLVTLCYTVQNQIEQDTKERARLNRMLTVADPAVLLGVRAQLDAARRARVALGLEPDLDVPVSGAGTGTSGTPSAPAGRTSGTGTRVEEVHLDLGGAGTDGASGTGTDDEEGTGTREGDDLMRAWSIVNYMREHALDGMPSTRELRRICAAPGRTMSSQDVAIRARDLALAILMEEKASEKGEIDPGE